MKYRPMLAKLGDEKDLKREGYIFEPKLDGTRAICYFDGKEIKLINRRDRNITHRYPEFGFAKLLKRPCVLDGEIIVYKKGLPNFNLLQKREQLEKKFLIETRSKEYPATFVVFDILESDGKNLTKLPLSERKKILDKAFRENKRLQKIVFTKDGAKLWKAVKKKNIEGVMGKKFDGAYFEGKRRADWVKVKFTKTMDCIIVGYTTGKRVISALVLAAYYKGKLKFVGKVGTGFTVEFLRDLHGKLEKIRTDKKEVETDLREKIYWVKKKYVCEAKYLELSKNKIMRAPVFLRLRDKALKECVVEA